jgi:serine/threonine protein kinase
MSQPTRHRVPELPLHVLEQIDRICERFEAAWRASERPAIEDYLGHISVPERPALLRELIAVDLDRRRRVGERPQPGDYLGQFPDASDTIEDAFHCVETLGNFPTTAQPMTALEPGAQIGDFKIERRLGAGGMGIVYLARQVSLDRIVALKVLGVSLNREADIARFGREAQVVAKLHHPGIATVHFVGQDGQVRYLAMEYIDGASLATLIDRLGVIQEAGETLDSVLKNIPSGEAQAQALRFDDPTVSYTPQPSAVGRKTELDSPTPEAKRLLEGPVYIRRCCELIRDTALALGHAHQYGVVHRDIKPGNILLDRQGQVHLIDFGLARFFEDATVTGTGSLIGTPLYMSPEQVTGRLKLDRRTDIYSLGLVLYEFRTHIDSVHPCHRLYCPPSLESQSARLVPIGRLPPG